MCAAALFISKPHKEACTGPWLSLWESCRHSRLRGFVLHVLLLRNDRINAKSPLSHLRCQLSQRESQGFLWVGSLLSGKAAALFLVFFLGALVVDDLHMLGVYHIHIVFLCPLNAALQNKGEEDARDIQNHFKRVVGKFDLVVGAVRCVADGGEGLLPQGKKLGKHAPFSVEPEIFAVAIAVVHGKGGEILGAHAVDNGVGVFFSS